MNLTPFHLTPLPASALYLSVRVGYAFCWGLLTTLSLVYMVEVVRLDALQMVLVGTVLEAAVFFFEIPTGVVADLVSRRLSVIIGHALMGAGWLLMAAIPEFAALLVAQVVWGVGWTFISGAFPAWLSGELGKANATQVMLRGSQWAHVASFFGIGAAVWLGGFSLSMPLWIGGAGLVVLAAFMSVAMQETGFRPASADERIGFADLGRGARAGWQVVRGQRALTVLLLVAVLYGAFSEGLDRLFTPFLLERFEFPRWGGLSDVAWWGLIAAIANLASFGAVRQARRSVRMTDDAQLRWVLSSLQVAIALLVVALAFSPNLAVLLGCYWAIAALRSAYGPLMTGWLNHKIPEQSKATVFSLYGQADSGGQMLIGPGVGGLARTLSIGAALTLSALVLLPTALLLGRSGGKGVR